MEAQYSMWDNIASVRLGRNVLASQRRTSKILEMLNYLRKHYTFSQRLLSPMLNYVKFLINIVVGFRGPLQNQMILDINCSWTKSFDLFN